MRVLACLLAGLLAGTMAPIAVVWDKNDRGAYNNKMALLEFLLERARSAKGRTGRDLQKLYLLMSIAKNVTDRYVATNPEDAQIK